MSPIKTRWINADKPHLWKSDVATSVDRFNQWFMDFAPEAFRSTRVQTTEHVKAALVATNDLRTLDAATLKANPGALPTIRMCTAPPLAVDRLVGLADTSKNLVGRMERGKLPTKMPTAEIDEELNPDRRRDPARKAPRGPTANSHRSQISGRFYEHKQKAEGRGNEDSPVAGDLR